MQKKTQVFSPTIQICKVGFFFKKNSFFYVKRDTTLTFAKLYVAVPSPEKIAANPCFHLSKRL